MELSARVRGTQVPNIDWELIPSVVLHAGYNDIAMDRLGHRRLAFIQFGDISADD